MKEKFVNVAMIGEGWEVKRFSLWEKYGKKRIYITREDGKKTYGYIDCDHDNQLICDSDMKYTLQPFVADFFEKYEMPWQVDEEAECTEDAECIEETQETTTEADVVIDMSTGTEPTQMCKYYLTYYGDHANDIEITRPSDDPLRLLTRIMRIDVVLDKTYVYPGTVEEMHRYFNTIVEDRLIDDGYIGKVDDYMGIYLTAKGRRLLK